MRSAFLLLVPALACSTARPSPGSAAPRDCDLLPFVGAAVPRALASDAEGGLALAGDFSGVLRVATADVASAGATDVFVLRTAPGGEARWLRRIGGVREERAGAVALAANGDVVVAGSSEGRCFAARLRADDGSDVWKLGFDGDSLCRALAFDAQGDVWAAGSFSGSLFGLARSRGMTDAFVARIDGATGAVRLLRGFGGKGRDLARAVAVSPAGEVVVAGQFGGEVDPSESEVDFGAGPLRSAGDSDAFVLALGPDGATRWASGFGDDGNDGLAALAFDPGGALYAAGHHQPAADYQGLAPRGVGNFTAQVVRISPQGRGEWVRMFEGRSSSAESLAFDGKGRLWLAGAFTEGLRLDALALASAGKADAFAVALSPVDGAVLGSRTWGTRDDDAATAIARIPGGFAAAGVTGGELQACGKALGTAGETTAFLISLRDL